MRVEGESADECGAEIEDFDARLAQKIQALSGQIESQTLHLANLRRNAPVSTARKYEENFTREWEEFEAKAEKDKRVKMEAAGAADVSVSGVERREDTERTWTQGVESLQELKTGMGGTVARMEKATQAVEVLDGRGD